LLTSKKKHLANNLHLLDTVSPLATLARGYSISFNQNKIVKSVKNLQIGEKLTTRLSDGDVHSEITQINEKR
jgi:exodeoxyribonuclease VII large subunit